jgi:hypothetical protein
VYYKDKDLPDKGIEEWFFTGVQQHTQLWHKLLPSVLCGYEQQNDYMKSNMKIKTLQINKRGNVHVTNIEMCS